MRCAYPTRSQENSQDLKKKTLLEYPLYYLKVYFLDSTISNATFCGTTS